MSEKQLTWVIFTTIVVGAVWAAPLSAGPVNPLEILLQHYEAVGGLDRVKAEKTAFFEGRISHDGLQGRIRQWHQVPLKFRVEEDFTVIEQAYGDDGARSWSQDANGQVIIHRDEETLKRRQIKRLLQNFDHLDPGTQNFSLSYEGLQAVDGISCHVVRTANRINDDICLDYFNARTFMLEKSVLRQPDLTFHTRYTDYRDVAGVRHAFREETDIQPKQKRISVEIDTYTPHVAIDAFRFEVPPAAAADFKFEAGDRSEDIPIERVENSLFIPVTVSGDTRLWALDSGASMSVIDRGYAVKLGLEIHAGIRGSGLDGVFQLDFVTLPEYRVPGARFQSQKLFCLDGLAERSYEPQVVGIMGFDFLSRFVTRIDYASNSLSFYDPATFSYTGPGTVIEAPLKEKTFSLPMTIEGAYRGRWALDLGADNVSFHYPFAHTHGLDRRPGVERVSADLSGAYVERAVNFTFVELGGFRVNNVLIGIPLREGSGANSGREMIGNIGNSLLRRFVVTLDYRRQQVILEKGRHFERPFPRDGSGLVIGLSQDNRPMVSYVAPGTPGERAGFQAGDLIEAVGQTEGSPPAGVVAIRDLLRAAPGTRYRIEILRDGRSLRIPLTLEDLYAKSPEKRNY